MTAASMETMLELWASSLRGVKARIRRLFTQVRVAASAGLFLDGLLGPERRKTGWMRAEAAAGDPGPKRGAFAAGITNCQVGVFAAYVSRHGHAFVDRALYLPKAWADDPGRLAAAHVPAEVGFATKPRLARRMVECAIAAGVPFSWVAADSVHGVGEVEMALRRAGKGYVLGVNASSQLNSWGAKPLVAGTAEEIAQELDPTAWQRLSAGEGTKGPRLYGWAYLELADLGADEYKSDAVGLWTRGLLVRRNIADGACASFTTWCPAGTGVETLVQVEGQRWSIGDSFECAKNELGLDHNESGSWHGWHRHVSLVMLAFAMMATVRHHANPAEPRSGSRVPVLSKTTRRPTHARQASSAGRSRRSAALPPAWRSGVSGPHASSPGRSGAGRTKPPRNAHI